MTLNVVFLPGDGVGPEVSDSARSILEATVAKFNLDLSMQTCAFGGAAIDSYGDPFPVETQQACLSADAIFLGAVGGPKWDGAEKRPESGLLALRKTLDVYANLRPVQVLSGMENLSPLKPDLARNIDILIVRELTGGLYFGDRTEGDMSASDICTYTRAEVQRVARIAFRAARERRGKVVSVDKANVLATSRLWRSSVIDLHQSEFADVELEHMLVDAMAMKLIQCPAEYDVLLTENLFGDILSDEASVLSGSIGMAPSASLGDGTRGLYEPIHGSAPDIAGTGKANPVGAILSVAMLLRHSLEVPEAADIIEVGVQQAIKAGYGTGDIGGQDSTQNFTEKLIALL
ncbi:3-isopropylmalate dehydrogenase [Parvularcula sp. IMCC14364]|uniref:3-isopropylmalate dehydrogenase n=1 Tax=Parvularcula sp. IMCC14364 TaxID=3067902 RepID=UPI00274133D9|nr:3-isopropylmalate dehydrogenase [Parvularcula sp. IMCC14364]